MGFFLHIIQWNQKWQMTILTQMGSPISQGILLLQVWCLNIFPFLRFYSDNLFSKLYKSDDRKWLLHPKSPTHFEKKKHQTSLSSADKKGDRIIFKKGGKRKKKHYNNFNITLHLVEIKKVFFVVSCNHWPVLIWKLLWRISNMCSVLEECITLWI